jgi:hypothetical protein
MRKRMREREGERERERERERGREDGSIADSKNGKIAEEGKVEE